MRMFICNYLVHSTNYATMAYICRLSGPDCVECFFMPVVITLFLSVLLIVIWDNINSTISQFSQLSEKTIFLLIVCFTIATSVMRFDVIYFNFCIAMQNYSLFLVDIFVLSLLCLLCIFMNILERTILIVYICDSSAYLFA